MIPAVCHSDRGWCFYYISKSLKRGKRERRRRRKKKKKRKKTKIYLYIILTFMFILIGFFFIIYRVLFVFSCREAVCNFVFKRCFKNKKNHIVIISDSADPGFDVVLPLLFSVTLSFILFFFWYEQKLNYDVRTQVVAWRSRLVSKVWRKFDKSEERSG